MTQIPQAPARYDAGTGIEDIYTLSPLQQGMLFHILSAPKNRFYLDQTVCTLRGKLDPQAFEEAWGRVQNRHPALRTGFLWEGLSKPVQVVYREVPVALEILDWRPLAPRLKDAQLQAFLRDDRRRDFDLTHPPLMRLHLIQMDEQIWRVVWTVSHLISDAWCATTVLSEVVQIYESLRRKEPAMLPKARPYRDFIAWLKRRDLASSEHYWRQRLAGYRKPVHLVEEEDPRWSSRDAGHRQESLRLSTEKTRDLRQLAREHQLTLNTLVQGAWALVLAHQTERDDVVYGTTMAGRPADLEGVEGIVGPFINTLPQRVKMDASRPLVQWLQELQGDQLEMRLHEQAPLRRIQSWSELQDGERLFSCILVFLSFADLIDRNTGSLELSELRYIGRPHYGLTVNVQPGKELILEMTYDMRSYPWVKVCEYLDQLSRVLTSFLRGLSPTVGEVLEDLATDQDRRRENQRRRRRDSNTDKLRITRPVPVRMVKSPSSLSEAQLLQGEGGIPPLGKG
ncbi:MAG: condensation domain-containing protein [Acidobacteriota bacterium]